MIRLIKVFKILSILVVFSLTLTINAHSKSLPPARILLLETMPVPVVLEHSRWFINELKSLGYKNDENLDLVIIQANGDRLQAKALLRKAISEKYPDIVITNATLASQAALEILKGTQIPIVFMTVSDPVGAGIIKQIGMPTGSNITGRVHMINRETKINMVMQLIGKVVSKKPIRFGFIHSSYPSSIGDLEGLRSVAKELKNIVFVPYEVVYKKVPEGSPEMLRDVAKGIEVINDKIDFWWEPSGPLGELTEYTQLLLEKSNKPIVMGTKVKSVVLGALLHLTPSIEGSGREAARIADAIIKGSDPGSIPPLPPADFDMGVNLKTAIKHGIVIPPDILKLAGDNVFH
jgi:putative tryptophan/tyrosine transport system substrate-binding protein